MRFRARTKTCIAVSKLAAKRALYWVYRTERWVATGRSGAAGVSPRDLQEPTRDVGPAEPWTWGGEACVAVGGQWPDASMKWTARMGGVDALTHWSLHGVDRHFSQRQPSVFLLAKSTPRPRERSPTTTLMEDGERAKPGSGKWGSLGVESGS